MSADRLLRREGHPLGVQRYYEDPADESFDDAATNRKWTFGVAAGALLVAGTFAAGALGLNNTSIPVAENVPEHAPSAPGHGPNGPGDIGTPAVAAPPHGKDHKTQAKDRTTADRSGATVAARQGAGGGASGGSATSGGSGTVAPGGIQSGGGPATPAPAPAPAPTPRPAPQPAPRPGTVEQIVTPVQDTIGGVTDTVGGVLSPVTGLLSSNQQPALTMIDPLGDLLGN